MVGWIRSQDSKLSWVGWGQVGSMGLIIRVRVDVRIGWGVGVGLG